MSGLSAAGSCSLTRPANNSSTWLRRHRAATAPGRAGMKRQRRAMEPVKPRSPAFSAEPISKPRQSLSNCRSVARTSRRWNHHCHAARCLSRDVRTMDLPEGWLAGLIDADGNFIARSRNHEQSGRAARVRRLSGACAAPLGWNETRSLEGVAVATAHVPRPSAEWVMNWPRTSRLSKPDPRHGPGRRPGRRRDAAAEPAAGDVVGAAHCAADRADRARHPRPMLRRTIAFANTGLPRPTARSMRWFPRHACSSSTTRSATSARRMSPHHAGAIAPLEEPARHRAGDRAPDRAPHDFVQRVRVAVQFTHPGAGRCPRSAGRAAMERRVHRRSGAGAARRLRHRKGDLPRRADHAAHRGGAERGAGAARACHTRRNTVRCRCRPARSTSTGHGSRASPAATTSA